MSNNKFVKPTTAEDVLIAIPLTEYKKLKEQTTEILRLRQSLEHHLKYKPNPPPMPEALPVNSDQKTELKTGQGADNLLNTLLQQVQSLQSAVKQLQNSSSAQTQIGAGAQDLPLELPESLPSPKFDHDALPIDTALNSSAYEQITPNSSNDIIGDLEAKLLETLSPHLRAKANLLLNKLKPYSSDIRFEKNGTLYINNQILPDANSFELFPLLFKPSSFTKHPGLQTLVNEIATLGFSNLISRYYSAGLTPRGKNFISNRHEVRTELKTKGPYWFKISE